MEWTAEKAKIELMDYFINRLGFPFVVSEFENCSGFRADIFAMDEKCISLEIEVKLDFGDLVSELNSIQKLKKRKVKWPEHGFSKFNKHRFYLFQNEIKYHLDRENIIPHHFYFAIPENLYDTIKNIIRRTPYGLIILPPQEGLFPRTFKMAIPLHNYQIKSLWPKFVKRISRENLSLKRRLLN